MKISGIFLEKTFSFSNLLFSREKAQQSLERALNASERKKNAVSKVWSTFIDWFFSPSKFPNWKEFFHWSRQKTYKKRHYNKHQVSRNSDLKINNIVSPGKSFERGMWPRWSISITQIISMRYDTIIFVILEVYFDNCCKNSSMLSKMFIAAWPRKKIHKCVLKLRKWQITM